MQYIFDTNYYRNIVIDKTKEELEEIRKLHNQKTLFPTIVSVELINHLSKDDNAREDCLKALSFLFNQSSEIQNGRASGNVVPSFHDLLTLYFYSVTSNRFSLANKTLLMAKSIYENHFNNKDFFNDIETIKKFKKEELESIIGNIESYYLSSFDENRQINWKIFQENIELGNELNKLIKEGSINELFGISLLKLATECVDSPKEITVDYFRKNFLKDFEISIDFFVQYILKKLLEVKNTDYLKYLYTDPKKRWNSFYDFQLIFAVEFENSRGRETIFVTKEKRIQEHFKKFNKSNLVQSIEEFNNRKFKLKEVKLISKEEAISTLPSVLYKYRDWSNDFHKKILLNHELYFPSFAELNDPFDGQIPFRYDSDNVSFEDYKLFLRKMNEKAFNTFTKDELKTKYQDFKTGDDWKEYYPQHLKVINENLGVYSLSTDNINQLMWSHYANSHRGFCIGFDTQTLFDVTEAIMGYVEYCNIVYKTPFSLSYPFYLDTLFRKKEPWKYENEVRMLKTSASKKVFKLNKNSIKEIIFGINMSNENRLNIINVVNENFENVDFFEVSKNLENYDFEISKIEIE